MPWKNSSAIYLFSVLLGCAYSASGAPLPLDVMPAPAEVIVAPGLVPLTGHLEVEVRGAQDHRLAAAVARFESRWCALVVPVNGKQLPYRLVVHCAALGSAIPALGDDESYALQIEPTQATLDAATSVGAMHGLETFLQLPRHAPEGWFLSQVDDKGPA